MSSMSALGQKRTFRSAIVMSALPPIADMTQLAAQSKSVECGDLAPGPPVGEASAHCLAVYRIQSSKQKTPEHGARRVSRPQTNLTN
jgi:hypothetical protein